MIQLNIFYPKKENAWFNWDYYPDVHMPLSLKLQGFYKGCINSHRT